MRSAGEIEGNLRERRGNTPIIRSFCAPALVLSSCFLVILMASRLLLFFLLLLPCLSCHSSCTDCPTDSTSQYDCFSCAPGFYLQPNQLYCLATCPSGYLQDGFSSTCLENPTQVFGLTFDSASIDWVDYRNQSKAYAGTSAANSWDGAEPYYTPGRGLRFDGSQMLQVEGYPRLGSSYTVAFWIFAENIGTLIAQRNSANNNYLWTLEILSGEGEEISYTYSTVSGTYTCAESISCKQLPSELLAKGGPVGQLRPCEPEL